MYRSPTCLCVILFLFSIQSFAQQQSGYWASVGAGSGTLPNVTVALAYEAPKKPHLIMTRLALNFELMTDNWPREQINDLGVLYGYSFLEKFRVGAGLSGVWGVKRGTLRSVDPDPLTYANRMHDSRSFAGVGIPAEIRYLMGKQNARLGLTAYANLNPHYSYAGLNICLYLGEFKN